MKINSRLVYILISILTIASVAVAAYHHEGEDDADNFLAKYADKAGTKLDHCALCHTGGSYANYKDKTVEVGSCQYCHEKFGYDASGNILDTLNTYGKAYRDQGSNADAITAIDDLDSDGDGYTNKDEIAANSFPGDSDDHPGLTAAPSKVYTNAQLKALGNHKQFMMMNTSRSGDFYAEYTGVPLKDLLNDAGILDSATGITVYAPDGWSQSHPLEYNADLDKYHVYFDETGKDYQYPEASYYYDLQADEGQNPDSGWCDYSAASCTGRSHGDAIAVTNGLKAILAYTRDGVDLDTGVLTDENKLDGEGSYRLVVPQKFVNAPDQSVKSSDQDVTWPYVEEWDHNAGACTRSVTIIRVEPLPEGTTDIDILEAGWNYVDEGKIIIYGAIDGTPRTTDLTPASSTTEDTSSSSSDSSFGCFIESTR